MDPNQFGQRNPTCVRKVNPVVHFGMKRSSPPPASSQTGVLQIGLGLPFVCTHDSPIGMTLPLVGPVAPYEPERLPPFFMIFLFRVAVAETMQLELVAAARAAIAKRENFIVVVVGYFIVVDCNSSARVIILCLLLCAVSLIYLHYYRTACIILLSSIISSLLSNFFWILVCWREITYLLS